MMKRHQTSTGRILTTAFFAFFLSVGQVGEMTGHAAPSVGNPSPQTGAASLSEVSAINVMCAPNGIAAAEDGSLLVTDAYHKQIWQVKEGASQVYAGAPTVADLYGQPMGGYNDSEPLSSYFRLPWDVAPFMDGWAVSDTENDAIRIVKGNEVKTFNGQTKEKLKTANGNVVFNRPTGLAADDAGNLYVSDTGNGAVRKLSPQGLVTTVASGLRDPIGLCWKNGVLYIAEAGANRIVKVENGRLLPVAGKEEEGMEDGPAQQAAFSAPHDVAAGDDGTIYVSDTLNSSIRRIRGDQVDTLAIRDMTQAKLGLVSPSGLLLQGNRLYICDKFSRKLFVLELK